jgi:glycosyltransferase involved in cell wall biosynthesis
LYVKLHAKTQMKQTSASRHSKRRSQVAIFAATSGHSGVDRIVKNLVEQFDAWGQPVDLLQIRGHGPALPLDQFQHVRQIDLGVSHVNTSLRRLIRYLREDTPKAMLTDKDRVNRIAIIARSFARTETTLAVRLGTTVSANLAGRDIFERWVQRTSMRRLYPLANRVILPSEQSAADLSDYTGLTRSQIKVVRSPIVSERIKALANQRTNHPWYQKGEPPVVLGVGELCYRKDFATLIRAFAEVRRKRPCRLVILGRGRRRNELLALAHQLGVANDIALPGFTSNPYPFMAASSVYVLSSLWEGMPVALIEALACGAPVVATDCPSGPREVLGNANAGLLVPVGEVGPMAAAIDRQLDRRNDHAAFARLIEPYRIHNSAAEYLKVLGINIRRESD